MGQIPTGAGVAHFAVLVDFEAVDRFKVRHQEEVHQAVVHFEEAVFEVLPVLEEEHTEVCIFIRLYIDICVLSINAVLPYTTCLLSHKRTFCQNCLSNGGLNLRRPTIETHLTI